MKLTNYTSGVPVSKTISRVEEMLAQAGACNIIKEYKAGMIDAFCFGIKLPPENRQILIRLPANVDAVYECLKESIKKPRKGTLDKLREQAERTAWKIVQDWVEVQISLIQMQKIDFLQVFLSFVWNGETTFYHALQKQDFKLLTEG